MSKLTPEAAWDWLAEHENLEISYDYGHEGEVGSWLVHRQTGNINDREWEEVGSGATPLEAVRQALANLKSPEEQ